jgi:nucleoside-diphosphate-sugar epimerase
MYRFRAFASITQSATDSMKDSVMARRILVTGGTGTVGRVVTQRPSAQVCVLSHGLRPRSPLPRLPTSSVT